MKSDRTLDRALSSLAHPICLAAILLLLINDHVLKWHYGSWLTGKLSDVAWLVFAPLMFIALLSWISPLDSHRTAILAFTGVGILFAGAKTIPVINDGVRSIQAMFIGASDVDMRRDPTDLIALPALLVGWYVSQ